MERYGIVTQRFLWARGEAPVVLPDNRRLVRAEVLALVSLYFPPYSIEQALNVSYCESNWWTGAWNLDGEDSRGLFQLNVDPAAHPELLMWNLGDPQINCYFAGEILKNEGWAPWSCARDLGYTSARVTRGEGWKELTYRGEH